MEECGQLSNPGNDPLSVLTETIEKIHLMWVSIRQSLLETGVNHSFVLFKKPFQIMISMLSSVLGTIAIAEPAVGTAL